MTPDSADKAFGPVQPMNVQVGCQTRVSRGIHQFWAFHEGTSHAISAYLFGGVYKNQWGLQLGAQYDMNPRVRLRLD